MSRWCSLKTNEIGRKVGRNKVGVVLKCDVKAPDIRFEYIMGSLFGFLGLLVVKSTPSAVSFTSKD